MSTPENKLQRGTAPQSEPVVLPQQGTLIVSDSEHQIMLEKRNGVLSMQVNRLDRPLFSAAVTPESQVHLVFAPGQPGQPLTAEAVTRWGEEPKREPEHPPITIEGVPARHNGAKYDKETRTYKLIIAHHPDPTDRTKAEYYEIVAEGDKAEECYRAYVTDSRIPVRITGDDLSYTQKRKDKPDRVVRKIQADSVEKIKGRWDNPDILREKVRLTDLKE